MRSTLVADLTLAPQVVGRNPLLAKKSLKPILRFHYTTMSRHRFRCLHWGSISKTKSLLIIAAMVVRHRRTFALASLALVALDVGGIIDITRAGLRRFKRSFAAESSARPQPGDEEFHCRCAMRLSQRGKRQTGRHRRRRVARAGSFRRSTRPVVSGPGALDKAQTRAKIVGWTARHLDQT